MRNLFLAGTILVVLAAQVARAQTHPPLDNSFLLRLPQSVDTTDLSIFYFLTGPFGGYGSFLRTKPNVWEYEIDTSNKGKSAETLKAIIYCPGYGIELVNVPSLAHATSRSASIALKPLPAVRLTGKVNFPENNEVNDFRIEVVYSAYWSHRFYGITEGPVALIKVASTSLSKDGSFSIMVPDFAADPSVNSFEDKGMLRLIIREPETGNIPYTLEREGQAGHEVAIKIGEGYGGELTLNAIPRVHSRVRDRVPQFRDYAVSETYTGKIASLVLTRADRMFRTRLVSAARNQRPNFAGHYILTTWGCGTSCVMGAIIDAKTGKAHWWNFSVCCWASNVDDKFQPIEVRLNSNLIVFSGTRNEKEGDVGTHFYKFEDGQFVHIRSVLKKE